MAFWSDGRGTEPKRNYRWVVVFNSNLGTTPQGLTYALKKVDKPKAKIAETTHKYLNHFFYYPGRLEWEAINMTFASLSGEDDTTRLLNNITALSGYGVPSGRPDAGPRDLATLGKRKFNAALGNSIIIRQLDADGNYIEQWSLANPFFTNITYGTLDYSNEDVTEISTTVRYDWAALLPAQAPSETAGVYPLGPTQ